MHFILTSCLFGAIQLFWAGFLVSFCNVNLTKECREVQLELPGSVRVRWPVVCDGDDDGGGGGITYVTLHPPTLYLNSLFNTCGIEELATFFLINKEQNCPNPEQEIHKEPV